MSRPRIGLRSLAGDSFSLWRAIGGWRGVVEANAPALIFVVTYLVRANLLLSAGAAVGFAGAAVLLRALQRKDLTPALAGVATTALSAIWAWKSGQAANMFAIGLLSNVGYLLVITLSGLVRAPVLGYVIGFLRDDATLWRSSRHRAGRQTRHRYELVNWLWAVLFALRLAVQAPLYFAHATTALGIAKIAMGPFLYGGVLWVSWLLVRALPPVEAYLEPTPGVAPEGAALPVSASALAPELVSETDSSGAASSSFRK